MPCVTRAAARWRRGNRGQVAAPEISQCRVPTAFKIRFHVLHASFGPAAPQTEAADNIQLLIFLFHPNPTPPDTMETHVQEISSAGKRQCWL